MHHSQSSPLPPIYSPLNSFVFETALGNVTVGGRKKLLVDIWSSAM